MNFLTMITISLFYCSEEAFILMNRWMIGKNLMIQKILENSKIELKKHHYLKKKIFTVT